MKFPKIKLTNSSSTKYKNQKTLNRFTEDNKYEIALEISNVGVWDWHIVKNKTFYSEEFKNIVGFSDSELKDTVKAWRLRVHKDDFEDYSQELERLLNGELSIFEKEYRIFCQNGKYKWVLAKGKVIEKTVDNKPTRVIGSIIDITPMKKRKSQLTENLQVINSENKRLQNFTHIVSHNLKTHIGNFKNILEFYDDTNDKGEKEDLIGHLKTISESLTATIVDLDDIISIKSKANLNLLNEHINLHSCVNKISDSLKLDSSKNEVTIHNALRKDETLFTNRPYLESIFYNLISNGIKYADPNKKSQIIVQSIHSKDTIKILISDNGIGIDMTKFKDQVFNMYQTFHGTERKDSRGIGLYITKTQIETLNGTIELTSKINEGSAFTLTFKKQKVEA
ncbi:sensor histidine kinase [Winogradskyella bathintestinalis]|uniref:histidine kinase n=1 Tax=Winogradskyella bathintestinalis TaxID=3035208 RepID=A0ABT7ZYF0_9FLAO|nr:PAS domain-containing sensor histidine kinase [Winogradskyella bathintestinalis]MDN3494045.1 PAS domain-containing sensor histidine kinase [Winogradskyella bathintestinalis]